MAENVLIEFERFRAENYARLERAALRKVLQEKGAATVEDVERAIHEFCWKHIAYGLLR